MRKLDKTHEEWLRATYKGRVNWSKRERSMYSHDVGSLPSLIKPLVGNTMPAGVVQPVNEDEIVKTVEWASKRKIPLVPRGKSTSGYGGVLPVNGGLVMDFVRMNNVIKLEGDEVTVDPGISWKKLDAELKKQGKTLRLYPSSYPSSTVAGWLAQGGSGFGSWEYGTFAENVVEVRVVRGDGKVDVVKGDDLQLVYEAEGITGLITSVTLKVCDFAEDEVRLIAFEDEKGLGKFAKALEGQPIWSISFVNPEMVQFQNKAPQRLHNGHAVEEKVEYPEKYLLTLTFRNGKAAETLKKLGPAIKETGGEILDQHYADHEWRNRFKIMKVKRLGPSLVPAEVIVPLDKLEDVLTELGKKVKQPLVIEGMGISGKEVVLLGFIPHDERSLTFNLTFPLSLTVVAVAKKHGGRGYATGLYFANQAKNVLGASRYAKMKQIKKDTDPRGILNPGKVLSSKMSPMMGLAGVFEPLLRGPANWFKIKPAERIKDKRIKDLPADVIWYSYACSSCGYCIDGCDQFYGRMWESQSPRGKWYYIRQLVEGKEKLDQKAVNTFMVCTTCEMCSFTCSEGLPVEESWMKLRDLVINEKKKMTIPPFEIMEASLNNNLNIWANYRENRDKWMTPEIKAHVEANQDSDTLYFAGCTASLIEQDISQSSANILKDAGIGFTTMGLDENCCGIPMLTAGKWDTFAEVVKHNIGEANKRGIKKVVTSCPACHMGWSTVYKEWAEKLGLDYNFEVQHYSETLAPAIAEGKLKFKNVPNTKVTYHDSCHMGRASGVYEPPRDLVKAIPGVELVEMEHNREEGLCCGSVLTLISEPLVAHDIGKTRLDEAEDVGAKEVLAMCPCCQFQLKVSADKKNLDVKITDLSAFVAKALGYDVKEDLPLVLDSWATFEGMIKMMEPKEMAQFMIEMFPEMIDAMPLGMGGMMKGIGKLGFVGDGLLAMMKPLFPVLFPLMMPGMMPKVMPAMLKGVAKRVPMPQHMTEQMPDLMPKAFGNLLPHMLPDVVPLISQPLIDYLRGRPIKSPLAVK